MIYIDKDTDILSSLLERLWRSRSVQDKGDEARKDNSSFFTYDIHSS
jgi:hypothetical protein